MTFDRVRKLREEEKLTQKELADYLKCSQACYCYYERGSREIPVDVLSRLADFYGTSTDYLLGRTDHPYPYPQLKK